MFLKNSTCLLVVRILALKLALNYFFNTLKVYLYVQYVFFCFFYVSLLSTKLCCVKTASARTDVLSSVLCSMVTLT